MYQWQARAVQFMGLDKGEIGLIGDGKKNIGQKLTVGIVNSVLKLIDELRARIGYLIIDECHRTPGRTFTEAVNKLKKLHIRAIRLFSLMEGHELTTQLREIKN